MQSILIVGGKGAGKTVKCIRLAAKHNSHIVCLSDRERRSIIRMSSKLGLEIQPPITYGEFIDGHFSSLDVNSVIIDNVDQLVDYIARGAKVIGMSIYAETSAVPFVPRHSAWEPPEVIK